MYKVGSNGVMYLANYATNIADLLQDGNVEVKQIGAEQFYFYFSFYRSGQMDLQQLKCDKKKVKEPPTQLEITGRLRLDF